MFKYRYTGRGVIAFEVDDKRYVVGVHDKRISTEVDLPRKVDVPGLELVELKEKTKKSKGE